MPSRFPGMDPYLEGYMWPDVHHRLATQISDTLMPQLRPKYVARIELRLVADETPEAEIGIMYPDVEILARPTLPDEPLAAGGPAVALAPEMTPSTITLTVPDVRLASVQIRDTAENQLVTSIEILSPVNKREPELSRYREKRSRLFTSSVHLLEIDLLRRGERPLARPNIPPSAYQVVLTRNTGVIRVWAVQLHEPLPVVPVPLRYPDPDIPLNLNQVVHTIYERAAYDLSIDYSQSPPPPELTDEESAFVAKINALGT
jgi:hypothetical protein